MNFEDPKGNRVEIESIKRYIERVTYEHPKDSFKIIIGTDSQKKGNNIFYITVIVVYRQGKGGTYFISRIKIPGPLSMKEKIYKEATFSLELAEKLKKFIEEYHLKNNLEVHVDVGENGETKSLIKEVIEMIEQRGYHTTFKPNSFAASKVADRHTK